MRGRTDMWDTLWTATAAARANPGDVLLQVVVFTDGGATDSDMAVRGTFTDWLRNVRSDNVEDALHHV